MIVRALNDGNIVVNEACTTEYIAAELFESADIRWLQFRDVSEGPDGVTGSFRITASNGEWTYRLLGRVPWLDGVFEAELALGEAMPCSAIAKAEGRQP